MEMRRGYLVSQLQPGLSAPVKNALCTTCCADARGVANRTGEDEPCPKKPLVQPYATRLHPLLE